MSNQIGDDVQSAQDEEDREGELLCLKIKAQLEDLFTDRHLAEDGFLLKHVQRNKQGYVSLKLLTCLKKIKALTTDWYMTLAGAEYSDLLEVNDECTKVRRIEPLPQWLLCSPTSKLLLVFNISAEDAAEDGAPRGPEEHAALSKRIFQKFSAHGGVKNVWILPPGQELPKELQCYAKRQSELGQHLCAVVKFDHLEAVRKAYSALRAEEEKSNGEGMSVVPLGFQSTHHMTKAEPSEENEPGESPENPLETSEDSIQEEHCSSAEAPDETSEESQPQESPDSSEQIPASSQGQPALNQSCGRTTWCFGDSDKDPSPSPWVQRRKSAASVLKPKVAGCSPYFMQKVLRQPFGPDDTKGFQGGGEPQQ